MKKERRNKMTKEEIDEVLELHKKWLFKEEGGKRALLTGADLRGANLVEADLREAYLAEANLRMADLRRANLKRASLREADLRGVNLMGANLEQADLEGADLFVFIRAKPAVANLRGANLKGASLRGANLREADLIGADLSGADLMCANLSCAKLDKANLTDVRNFPFPDLNILKHQGKIRAFKLVNKNYEGVFQGGVKYEIGKTIEEDNYDTDERILCARGLNVATLEWCLERKGKGNIILEVEFTAEDIVAIPYATDGKFRLKRCKVIREIKEA